MPFAVHPASQGANIALLDAVILGEGEEIAVGIEHVGVIIEL